MLSKGTSRTFVADLVTAIFFLEGMSGTSLGTSASESEMLLSFLFFTLTLLPDFEGPVGTFFIFSVVTVFRGVTCGLRDCCSQTCFPLRALTLLEMLKMRSSSAISIGYKKKI